MRILLITDTHNITGGAEKYFFDLKERLANTPGITVYSIGFGSKAIGSNFFVLPGLKSKIAKLFFQLIFHPNIFFALRKQIREFNPDVIHLHNVKQYTCSVLKAIKPYPVVQTIHDFTLICPTGLNLHKDQKVCETGLRRRCFWQHQTKYNKLTYLGV